MCAVCMRGAQGGQNRVFTPLIPELWLGAAMRMPGIKLVFSEREVSALNRGVISPVPETISSFKLCD